MAKNEKAVSGIFMRQAPAIPVGAGQHGGKRAGAGRKPVANPKVAMNVRLNEETIKRVKKLAETGGVSQAFVIETAVSKLKTL